MSQHPRRDRLRPLAAAVVVALVVAGVAFSLWSLTRGGPGGPGPGAAPEVDAVAEVLDAARWHIRQRETAKAESVLADAIERYPSEQSLWLLYAEVLLQNDQRERAYEAYDRAVFIGPDHAEYRHAAGTLAATLGDLESAAAHFSVAQKLAPANPKHPMYLGEVQRRLGDRDAARASFALASRLQPDLATAWAGLAGIALEENRPSVALDQIAKARTLEPRRVAWRVVEAQALRRLHRPEDAARLLSALPEPTLLADDAALEELSMNLGLLQQPAEAAELWVDAAGVRDQPDAEVLFRAASWLDRAGESERARRYAEAAAELGHPAAPGLARRLAEAG